MKNGKKWLAGALALVVVGLAVFFNVPTYVDGQMNTLVRPGPYAAGAAAQNLHKTLFVADMHDDALLWNRDLLTRYTRGHSDLPRELEAHMGLQVFATVTKTPKGMNYDHNSGDTDSITMLVMAQRWPVATWNSLLQRALYQAQKLQRAAADSQGRMVFVKSREDMAAFVQAWALDPNRMAAVLATEGLHPLEGKLENVDRLYDAGFRIAGLTHFFDNEVGGSAHGVLKGGLTELGRAMIRRMEAKGMVLDLAHASPKTFDDAIAVATRPLVVSHTGVRATCDNLRNLSDEQLRAVAKSGGVVGIGFWDTATCGQDAKAIARAIRHAANVAGVDHVGLGSDFDGAIAAPFDASGLAEVTDALLAEGFHEDEIVAIMGGNVARVLANVLPPS